MANGEKVKKDKLPEPLFEKQMDEYIDNDVKADDPIFSHAYQKFIVNLLKTRDKAIKDDLVMEVKTINNDFHDKLIGDVNEVIEKQWIRVLREELTAQSLGLNETLKTIAGDISEIKKRLKVTEGDVKEEKKELPHWSCELMRKKEGLSNLKGK